MRSKAMIFPMTVKKDNSLTVYLESEEDEKKDARALRSREAEEGNADEKED